MHQILEKVTDLNAMIKSGEFLKALEKHYHPDVVMQDTNMPACVGKAANIEREKHYIADVEAFQKAQVLKVAIGDSISMVEWDMQFTSKSLGEVNHTQIAVQTWKDGLIIHEHFYYYE